MSDHTPNEQHLLDVMQKLEAMGQKERRLRLARAINSLLQDAVKEGYSLDFGEEDGLHLHTPGDLMLWIPFGENEEILVIDKREDVDA